MNLQEIIDKLEDTYKRSCERFGMKCKSCAKGYNGRNGNGYQPCDCLPSKLNTPPPKEE